MDSKREAFTACQQDEGTRLDSFLSAALEGVTRSMAQQLIAAGNVLLNGAPAPKSARLHAGDEVACVLPPPRETTVLPQDIPLQIVYEDADLLVVNKPKGMVVHPAPGNYENTLVNALLFHCRDSLSGVGGENCGRASSTASTRIPAGCWWWPRTTPPTRGWRPSWPCTA